MCTSNAIDCVNIWCASEFGVSFNKAATNTDARIKQHLFDASIIELQKDDITKFIEYLHGGLLDE
jgi:ribonucleotide reductase beta subunit family protein with ferritin-like domain